MFLLVLDAPLPSMFCDQPACVFVTGPSVCLPDRRPFAFPLLSGLNLRLGVCAYTTFVLHNACVHAFIFYVLIFLLVWWGMVGYWNVSPGR